MQPRIKLKQVWFSAFDFRYLGQKDKRTDLKLTGMKNLSFCSFVQYRPFIIFEEDRRRFGIKNI